MMRKVTNDRQEAFERLWREEYALVFRTAYLIVLDREEAGDLAQEAFVRAYERWRTVSRMHNPAAWLQRVVSNLALSWRRRRATAQRHATTERHAVPGPQDVIETTMPDPALFTALRSLPREQRAVVALRFYADQSVEDTARALGKRPGTVKALTHQGIARLRALLTEEERTDGATRS